MPHQSMMQQSIVLRVKACLAVSKIVHVGNRLFR